MRKNSPTCIRNFQKMSRGYISRTPAKMGRGEMGREEGKEEKGRRKEGELRALRLLVPLCRAPENSRDSPERGMDKTPFAVECSRSFEARIKSYHQMSRKTSNQCIPRHASVTMLCDRGGEHSQSDLHGLVNGLHAPKLNQDVTSDTATSDGSISYRFQKWNIDPPPIATAICCSATSTS
jgi:hypothetical protein